MNNYYVYIISNSRRTVLYTGMTKDLKRRIKEHKSGKIPGFTARYNCKELIYFENVGDIKAATARERQIKKWGRVKKLHLIATTNPELLEISTEEYSTNI